MKQTVDSRLANQRSGPVQNPLFPLARILQHSGFRFRRPQNFESLACGRHMLVD